MFVMNERWVSDVRDVRMMFAMFKIVLRKPLLVGCLAPVRNSSRSSVLLRQRRPSIGLVEYERILLIMYVLGD